MCIYIYIYTEQQKKYHDPCLNSATLLNMRNGRKNRLPNIFISYLVFFFFFFLIFIPSTQQFHNISKLAYDLTHGPTIIYNFLNDRLIWEYCEFYCVSILFFSSCQHVIYVTMCAWPNKLIWLLYITFLNLLYFLDIDAKLLLCRDFYLNWSFD